MDRAFAGAVPHLPAGPGHQVNREQQQLQRRVRRNAWLLALLALAVYASYFLIEATRHAAG